MIKNKLKKLAIVAGIASTYLIGQAVYLENFPEKVHNIKDLMRITNEEDAAVRGNNPQKHIFWRRGATKWGTAASGKLAEGKYLVVLDQERDRTTIRHEIYHIYAGHCDRVFLKGEWTKRDKFFDEITANIYSYYGLRL